MTILPYEEFLEQMANVQCKHCESLLGCRACYDRYVEDMKIKWAKQP
jgi:hypothetical protein